MRLPYLTIAEPCSFEIDPIKHLRFLAYATPVSDEAEAQAFIETIRIDQPDARHHCWAYVLREPERIKFSDDGEPGGSAGKPMLMQLQGREVYDLVVVVVRYFGGTKLGVGGLMRAYGGAVGQLLDRAAMRTVTPSLPLWLEYDYVDTTKVDMALAALDLVPAETVYAERIKARLQVPDTELKSIADTLKTQASGRIHVLSDH